MSNETVSQKTQRLISSQVIITSSAPTNTPCAKMSILLKTKMQKRDNEIDKNNMEVAIERNSRWLHTHGHVTVWWYRTTHVPVVLRGVH